MEQQQSLGVDAVPTKDKDRPDPDWVRGECVLCGQPLVSNAYYVGGRGYIIYLECWGTLQCPKTCSYRRVL